MRSSPIVLPINTLFLFLNFEFNFRLSYNVARSTPSSPTRENNRRSMDIGNSTPASNLTPDGISLISHRRNNSHPTETSILETQTPKTPEL